MVFIYQNQPVALHLAQLIGKCTAVNAQIICQLLAIEWNIKFSAILPCGLEGEIGEQAAADGLGGSVKDAAGEV